ncbi:MAG TPA: hypothetical protein VGR96_08155 [Acidobacteriaceae bacterium]|nr:hypothetical protein [Acidobacteriaceae bacterium]
MAVRRCWSAISDRRSLAQGIYGLALGDEDLNGHEQVREDRCGKRAFGRLDDGFAGAESLAVGREIRGTVY